MDALTLTEIVATKDNQKSFAKSIIQNVLDGNETALNTFAKIKFITDALKEAHDEIKSQVIAELSNYDKNEKAIALGGFECSLKEIGVKYDYSNCNHPLYKDTIQQIEKLTEVKKEIEKFLQSIKQPIQVCSAETYGEEVMLYPPVKSSTTTPVLQFTK